MGLLDSKVALVTGAARGIGKAIALKFASEGARVVIMDLVIDNAAMETVKEINDAGKAAGTTGVVCRAYSGNAAILADAENVVNKTVEEFGRLDILVNNAGITRDGLMLRMSEDQWDSVINVNLKSAFNFTHAAIPVMARQRCGSIINMSSVVGESGNAGQANYAASKAGLIGLAKSIAKEMGPRGIRANCIAPGFIISDMTRKLGEDKMKEWEAMIPLRRGGTRSGTGGGTGSKVGSGAGTKVPYKVGAAPVGAPSDDCKTLVLKDFTMLRNYDCWLAGASEFFCKIGAVESFTASTEAEMYLYNPSITDFMVVLKRDQVGIAHELNTVLVSEWTGQFDSAAFLLTEDDGGTITTWACSAMVKCNSKSYGFEIKIPFNSRDDIVWRGMLSRKYIESSSTVTGHFGDVVLTFEIK